MSDRASLLDELSDKEFRDSYLSARVRSSIAFQVRLLRKKLKLTQKEFAAKIGKRQSDVSHIEDPDGDQISVQTLIDIVTALDVGLVIRIASYDKFIDEMSDMSPEALSVMTIQETIGMGHPQGAPASNQQVNIPPISTSGASVGDTLWSTKPPLLEPTLLGEPDLISTGKSTQIFAKVASGLTILT